MRSRQLVALILPFAFAIGSSAFAIAQANRTIRVTGSGKVSDTPNQVTVRGTLSVSDESVEKAAEKFAKAKDEFTKAMTVVGDPEVAVEFAGEKLATGGGGWADAGAAFAVPDDFDVPLEEAVVVGQFSMTEEVVLRLPIGGDMEREGIVRKIGGVIAAARKAGLTLGAAPNPMFAAMGMAASSGMTHFDLDEKAKVALRVKAYKAAMSDARTRAAALAELSGGRLGKVISVEEVATPETGSDLESLQMAMLSRMFGGAIGGSEEGIDHNGRIELQQQLSVTFELVE